MPTQSPFDRSRFRLGCLDGVGSIVLALVSAAGSLADGAPERALLPPAIASFMLWWLRQLPRENAP
jgi:hypothetical protein